MFESLLTIILSMFGFALLIVTFFIIYHFPESGLLVIFFSRPLLELGRLTSLREQLVNWVIGPFSVLITAIMLLVAIFHKKLFNKFNALLFGFIGITIYISLAHTIDSSVIEILARMLTPLVMIVFPQLIIINDRQAHKFLRIVAYSTVFIFVALILGWGETNINRITGEIQDMVESGTGEEQARMGAAFGVPTVTAFWLFQFFSVSYFLFDLETGSKRIPWLLISLILLYGIYATYSRAAWFSVALLVVGYNTLRRKFHLALIVIFLGFLMIVVQPDLLLRILDLTSIIDRLAFWGGYLRSMVVEGFHIWFLGLGWADLATKNIFSGYLFDEGSTALVENTFVFLVAGIGVLPLLLFLSVIGQLCCRAYWLQAHGNTDFSRRYGAWTLSLLASWFIMSMSGEVITYTVINWYFYIFFGWASALFSLESRERKVLETVAGPSGVNSVSLVPGLTK